MKVFGVFVLIVGALMMQLCTAQTENTNEKPNRCTFERDSGPCRALMPRFYYDFVEDACKPFNYGGCSGNGNRFMTQKNCEDLCLD